MTNLYEKTVKERDGPIIVTTIRNGQNYETKITTRSRVIDYSDLAESLQTEIDEITRRHVKSLDSNPAIPSIRGVMKI